MLGTPSEPISAYRRYYVKVIIAKTSLRAEQCVAALKVVTHMGAGHEFAEPAIDTVARNIESAIAPRPAEIQPRVKS
jgi:hypothetical protein